MFFIVKISYVFFVLIGIAIYLGSY